MVIRIVLWHANEVNHAIPFAYAAVKEIVFEGSCVFRVRLYRMVRDQFIPENQRIKA